MSESVGSTPAGLGFGLGRSNETRRAGKIQGGCEAVLTFEAKGSQSCYGSSSGDEGLRLQFLSTQTLWHVAEAVCEHVLGGSRGDDNGIYEHLWEFRAGHETARGARLFS